MKPATETIAAILRHPYACGWRDKDGLVRLSWGNNPNYERPQISLAFQHFFPTNTGTLNPWNAFPLSGSCGLENFWQGEAFLPHHLESFELSSAVEAPSKEEWKSLCGKIEEKIQAGEFAKVVPARSRIFPLPAERVQRLKKELLLRLFSGPSDAYCFFLKWEQSWFFGATPEILFRKQGDSLHIPAIAGTRTIPQNPQDLPAVERELLTNAKERAEHEFVVRGIRETLTSLGLPCEHPAEPVILRLKNLMHLYTPIQCPHGGLTAEAIVRALHPTAAVGGYPKLESGKFLKREDSFARGLFASPLLFKTHRQEICLVGIRSALLNDDSLRFFAGAGYVAGSHWESEWIETGKKMDALAQIIGEGRSP